MSATTSQLSTADSQGILELYKDVRARTLEIAAPLEIEDYVVQTAEFMSPPRWHLGHTTWFFETILQAYQPGYKVYSEDFLFYFNSYYEGFGPRIDRPRRGTRSRPTVNATLAYRSIIDELLLEFLSSLASRRHAEKIGSLVRLGLEHEMQHQELLLYDIKHLLCDQFNVTVKPAPKQLINVEGMTEFEGGVCWLGFPPGKGSRAGFAFDNEKPAHQVFLQDFAIDRALVSNGDYLEFVRGGCYQDYRWWFSEAWDVLKREQWSAPLYWEFHDGEWMIRDFSGLHPTSGKATEPVCHVSYYEAAAFAKWAGKRLPTESEWERAATSASANSQKADFPWGADPVDNNKANFFENGLWSVAPIGAFPAGQNAYGCQQMIGDVWEWTSSDYVPYPGFRSEFEEYNDKWFVNQKVLRGGSFATPQRHIRSTYRNFFPPHERWMTAGFRCARDL
ncbi:MAG TPA: ergothioneine biosynthesis protein EgtB [Pyrinomonadaceae bacterium]|nr:ergothioneine biosynthesis protein EgtB [Pyrinomonadaceae bacterium]